MLKTTAVAVCAVLVFSSVLAQVDDLTSGAAIATGCDMYTPTNSSYCTSMQGCKWSSNNTCVEGSATPTTFAPQPPAPPAPTSAVNYYNDAQCSSSCSSQADCLSKSKAPACVSKEFSDAFNAQVAADPYVMPNITACAITLKGCLEGAVASSTVCSSTKTCLANLAGCYQEMFKNRPAFTSNPGIKPCVDARSVDWSKECKANLCSGSVPQFSQGFEPNTWSKVRDMCSASSVCDVAAPAAKLVTVTIKITASTTVEGVSFTYFQTATVEAQEAFKASFVEDLYASLGLDKNSVTITITSISSAASTTGARKQNVQTLAAAGLAIDYQVVKSVVQEEGAPAPSQPVLPPKGTPLASISRTLNSLASDLKVPASELAQVSVSASSDPVVTVTSVQVTLAPGQTNAPTVAPSTPAPTATVVVMGGSRIMSLVAVVVALAAFVLVL